MKTVDMYFDPTCPWAWMTSRWLKEVEQVRDVAVTFHVMSLYVLNEGKDLPADYRAHINESLGSARVAIAVEQDGGSQALDKFYTAYGEAFHVGGNHDHRAVCAQAVDAAGVSEKVLAAYDEDTFDKDLRASHQRSQDLVGGESGTPVVSFQSGHAFFGPVITPTPRGEAAGKLYDGLSLVTEVDGFYELKRARHKGPDFS